MQPPSAPNTPDPSQVLLLDGPTGTEFEARGVSTPLPAWSAHALQRAPEVLAEVHRDYANAGATVHTAATFRTRPGSVGSEWARLATHAVEVCREAVPATHRVAGSIAPLADCYRPDLSPPHPGEQHRQLAEVLAEAGADLLICETFPHTGEALAAVDAAISTGLPTWLALTAGPDASLLTPQSLATCAEVAVDRGVSAVLVNCVGATLTLPYVVALVNRISSVPVGAYGNAGRPDEAIGWQSGPPGPDRYAALAAEWVAVGARIVGGCCGTGPDHIRALRSALNRGTMPS